MMTSEEIIEIYEAMVELTGQMVQAAGAGDWEQLQALESACAVHAETLQARTAALPLSGPSRARKVDMIKKILSHDRRIRELTTPWMSRLSVLINHAGTRRRLARAYGDA